MSAPASVTIPDPSRLRVFVAVPCRNDVDAGFSLSLARMMAYSEKTLGTQGAALEVCLLTGTSVGSQRWGLVLQARAWGATHICWLDSDMTFPPATLLLLLRHSRPIVAANYTQRHGPPYWPTAMTATGHLYVEPESTGLAEVTMIGFGVVLTAMEVFERVPEPWFPMDFDPERREFIPEDMAFARAARCAGYELWVDMDLSQAVGHRSYQVLGAQDATREAPAQRTADTDVAATPPGPAERARAHGGMT